MSFYKREVNLILLAIKKGNVERRADLIEITHKPLRRIAKRYLINKSNILDVIQSSYLRVFQYIKSFDKDKDGYNWLCKIVQHVAYDFNKKEHEDAIFDENCYLKESKEYEIIFLRDEIKQYMQPYSREDQELIYLRFWKELSYKDIARLRGEKTSFIYKRITKIIKEILKNEKHKKGEKDED